MVDLNASLRALPDDLVALVLSHIEHVKTRQILALSSTFQEALSLPGALPRTFDFEGVAGDDIADLDRVRRPWRRSARVMNLCEYCGRNFEF